MSTWISGLLRKKSPPHHTHATISGPGPYNYRTPIAITSGNSWLGLPGMYVTMSSGLIISGWSMIYGPTENCDVCKKAVDGRYCPFFYGVEDGIFADTYPSNECCLNRIKTFGVLPKVILDLGE